MDDAVIAGGLACLAGATDVYGLGMLHDLYVSFMSGNTTMLGVAIGGGDWTRSICIARLIAVFVGGAALGGGLEKLGGSRHATLVTLVVGGLLSVPLLLPDWSVAALVLAMGALNAAMNRIGQAPISLTYVTGTLVKLGQGLGQALCGGPAGWTWLWQLPLWLSLLAGAVLAEGFRRRWGSSPWPLPVLAVLLACGTELGRRNGRNGTPETIG